VTSLQIVFRPQAEAESIEARRWYEQRRSGLGKEFARAVNEVVGRILENPFAFPPVRGQIRRAMLRRFPYAVCFRIAADRIVVLAVIHGRRHPRRWRTRR
jgi:plasmid stabilization system protein ParE